MDALASQALGSLEGDRLDQTDIREVCPVLTQDAMEGNTSRTVTRKHGDHHRIERRDRR